MEKNKKTEFGRVTTEYEGGVSISVSLKDHKRAKVRRWLGADDNLPIAKSLTDKESRLFAFFNKTATPLAIGYLIIYFLIMLIAVITKAAFLEKIIDITRPVLPYAIGVIAVALGAVIVRNALALYFNIVLSLDLSIAFTLAIICFVASLFLRNSIWGSTFVDELRIAAIILLGISLLQRFILGIFQLAWKIAD